MSERPEKLHKEPPRTRTLINSQFNHKTRISCIQRHPSPLLALFSANFTRILQQPNTSAAGRHAQITLSTRFHVLNRSTIIDPDQRQICSSGSLRVPFLAVSKQALRVGQRSLAVSEKRKRNILTAIDIQYVYITPTNTPDV